MGTKTRFDGEDDIAILLYLNWGDIDMRRVIKAAAEDRPINRVAASLSVILMYEFISYCCCWGSHGPPYLALLN